MIFTYIYNIRIWIFWKILINISQPDGSIRHSPKNWNDSNLNLLHLLVPWSSYTNCHSLAFHFNKKSLQRGNVNSTSIQVYMKYELYTVPLRVSFSRSDGYHDKSFRIKTLFSRYQLAKSSRNSVTAAVPMSENFRFLHAFT